MNQIPNIEEWKKLARKKLAPNVTYIDPKFREVASWAEELLNAFWVEQQKDLDAFINTLHQQLQKARQDWLREEIVRLEGMKGGIDDIDIPQLYKTLSEKVTFKNGHNQALQTIIDRYQAELDQEVSK